MTINCNFELTLVLDHEKFRKVFEQSHIYDGSVWDEDTEDHIDQSMKERGFVVLYQERTYRGKIKLLVDPTVMTKGNTSDGDKLIRRLEKCIAEYFHRRYQLSDFTLTGMGMGMNMDVGTHETVVDYLRVLKRLGRVKGFSPSKHECFDKETGLYLEGNSNCIDFLVFDLEQLMKERCKDSDLSKEQRKAMLQTARGILRIEVRLKKPKAIRTYTNCYDVQDQMLDLSKDIHNIFMDIMAKVIPFGEYYKKDQAMEILKKEVDDNVLRRKMMRLLVLIPEKKSLYLALQEMAARNKDEIMEAFARVNLSPVTISKRHDVKHLPNVYEFIL